MQNSSITDRINSFNSGNIKNLNNNNNSNDNPINNFRSSLKPIHQNSQGEHNSNLMGKNSDAMSDVASNKNDGTDISMNSVPVDDKMSGIGEWF